MLFRADPWLHVIAGCMSSGKTDELLRLLRRAEIAKRRILLVRPDVDDRTPAEYAESRSKARYPSTPVPKSEPVRILSLAREVGAGRRGRRRLAPWPIRRRRRRLLGGRQAGRSCCW
jgi:hypothetical protein